MKELLKIEYLKIKHYTVFRAFMLLFVVLVPLIFYSISRIEFPGMPSQKVMAGFPGVWSYLTYVAGWATFLPGILVGALVCNEVSFKTQKQNVIDGLSRMDVILSKFYMVLVLTLIVTLYIFLIGLIFGLIFTGATNMFEGIEQMLFFFIQTLGYLSLAMLVAVLIRRIAALAVIAFLIVYLFSGAIIQESVGEDISEWLPTNMLADLTEFPLYESFTGMQRMVDPSISINLGINDWLRAGICMLYIVGFIALSYVVMKKRDL